MKKAKVLNCLSLLFNIAIIALVVVGIVLTKDFVGDVKYFALASNLLVAVAALVCIPFNIKGFVKGEGLNKGALVCKFIGTVTVVALLVLTVSVFSLPTAEQDYGNNVLNQLGLTAFDAKTLLCLVVPVVSLLSFVCFDRANAKAKFFAIVLAALPVAIYEVFYILNVYLHFAADEKGSFDFYNILELSKGQTWLFAIILVASFVGTLLIAILLWLLNRPLAAEQAAAPAKEEEPAEEKVEEEPKEEAKEEPTAEPKEEKEVKAEEAPKKEEAVEPVKEEEPKSDEDEEVYIPVREEEKKPAPKKAAPKKAEEKKEEKPAPKKEEAVEPVKEEKPAEAKEEKKPAAKKAAPKAEKAETPNAEEKKAEPKEEKKPAPAKKTEAKPAEEKKPATKKAAAPKAEKAEAPKAEAKKEASPKAEEKQTKVYHLTKRKEDGMWAITFVGGQKAVKLFKTKKEAEEALKVLTENQGATALIRNSKGAKAGKFASSIKAEEKK